MSKVMALVCDTCGSMIPSEEGVIVGVKVLSGVEHDITGSWHACDAKCLAGLLLMDNLGTLVSKRQPGRKKKGS